MGFSTFSSYALPRPQARSINPTDGFKRNSRELQDGPTWGRGDDDDQGGGGSDNDADDGPTTTTRPNHAHALTEPGATI
eukprot:6947531-Pyramimonas_sp.AAC.1